MSNLGLLGGYTYQSAQVIPHFRNVRIQADSTRVSIKRIPILVDLVVKDTDRAPECWIPSVTVDGLLICFIRLGVLRLRHVAATEKIPALRIAVV